MEDTYNGSGLQSGHYERHAFVGQWWQLGVKHDQRWGYLREELLTLLKGQCFHESECDIDGQLGNVVCLDNRVLFAQLGYQVDGKYLQRAYIKSVN